MCDCIDLVNATLKTRGLQLTIEKDLHKKPSMTIGVERLDGPIRFDNRILVAVFCPICGERYGTP